MQYTYERINKLLWIRTQGTHTRTHTKYYDLWWCYNAHEFASNSFVRFIWTFFFCCCCCLPVLLMCHTRTHANTNTLPPRAVQICTHRPIPAQSAQIHAQFPFCMWPMFWKRNITKIRDISARQTEELYCDSCFFFYYFSVFFSFYLFRFQNGRYEN